MTAGPALPPGLAEGVRLLELEDYGEDSFEEESDEEEEERAVSETGTYVLDREEEERQRVRGGGRTNSSWRGVQRTPA